MEIQRLQGNLSQQMLQRNGSAHGDFQNALRQAAGGDTSLDGIFQRAAQETGVPVALLKAVGKAESNFNPNARSHCGAMGVMQLMPATAKTLGVSDPYNAEENIMAGAWHLRNMMDRFDGDTTLALAAYNAGSGNVYKYDGVPPFPETQNYVRKVMAYAGQDLTAGDNPQGLDGSLPSVGGSLLAESARPNDAEQMAMMFQTMIQWRLSEALNSEEENPATFVNTEFQKTMEAMTANLITL